MNLTTYKSNWSASCTAVSGVETFTADELTTVNLNNIDYSLVLMLPPQDISLPEKNYQRNQFNTVLYIINKKSQATGDEVVIEWSRMQGLLQEALDTMLTKTNVIASDGNRAWDYFDEVIGGNSLLSVRLGINIVTQNC